MSEEKENRDYDHKPSVRGFTSEYNVSSEENPKPTSGQEPFPVWLMITCVLLMVGGASIGSNSGGFNFKQSSQVIPPSAPSGLTGKAPELSEFEKYVNGVRLFTRPCVMDVIKPRVRVKGKSTPVDSEWVTQGTERFAQIVLNGLSGSITVNGASYGWQCLLKRVPLTINKLPK